MIYSYLVRLIIDSLAKLPSTEAELDSFDKLNFIKQNFSIKAINFFNLKDEDIDKTISCLYLVQQHSAIAHDDNPALINHDEILL